jgi:hypothetical protein
VEGPEPYAQLAIPDVEPAPLARIFHEGFGLALSTGHEYFSSRHIRDKPALYSRYLVLEAQLLPFESLHLELVNIDLFGETAYGDIQVSVGLLHDSQFFQQDGSFLFVYIQAAL